LNELPPARGAYIWYPYAPSAEFPIVGSGGRAAAAGPVFHRDDFRAAARPFPQYYDGKLFIYEFMRHWIMAVTMAPNGDLASIERFMPSAQFSAPIEMEFSPSGDLYLLEYGTAWFQGNPDARLVRIEYNAGNRKPIVAATVDKASGALPMRVALSSAGTMDLDEDSLQYVWTITRRDGSVVRRLTQPNPSFTFSQPGAYTASLTATDPKGARNTADVQIVAGNEPPNVDIDLAASNKSFFFPGIPVRYQVRVTDREDGSLRSGAIPASRVSVSAQNVKEWGPASASAQVTGRKLIEGNDCLSCHQFNRKSIGPAYVDVARKYHDDSTATARLVRKIRGGGSGVWGSVTMPAHPAVTEEQAAAMLAYIMSLADQKTSRPSLAARGAYVPPTGADAAPRGALILRAEYTDRGANGMPALSREKTVVLRSPNMVVASGELSDGVSKQSVPELPVEITVVSRSGASVALKQIDLAGIAAVTFSAVAPAQYQATGGKIEVHLDSPTGALLGETDLIRPNANAAAPPAVLRTVLRPTSGVHDVHLVFRNPDSKGDGFMFAVLTATFEAAPR
jgi:cytochrome c